MPDTSKDFVSRYMVHVRTPFSTRGRAKIATTVDLLCCKFTCDSLEGVQESEFEQSSVRGCRVLHWELKGFYPPHLATLDAAGPERGKIPTTG